MCVARPVRTWARAYTHAAVAWQGQAGRVVLTFEREYLSTSMRGAKHESGNSSGRGKRACCDLGKSGSGTVKSGNCRHKQGGLAATNKLQVPRKYGEF